MSGRLTLGRIPMRNLRAHPGRTIILFLIILAQAACMFTGLSMTASMGHEMSMAEARLGADILIYPNSAMSKISGKALLMQGTPVEVWKNRDLLKRLQDCEGIEKTACQLYIRDTTGKEPVWVVGFEPSEDFVIAPWTEQYDASGLPDGAVLAGCKVPSDQGMVILYGQPWPIAARLAETGSEMDGMVYVNLNTLKQLLRTGEGADGAAGSSLDPQTDFSVALVKVRDREDLESVTNWINVYVRKVKAVRSEAALTDTASGIHGQITLIVTVSAAVWIVLLLVLGISQSMMMKERRKELYLWHAIGAARSVVNRVMLKEAMLIYGTGTVVGVAVAWIVLQAFRQMDFSVPCALLTACLSLLAGAGSTGISIRRTTEALNGQMLLTV